MEDRSFSPYIKYYATLMNCLCFFAESLISERGAVSLDRVPHSRPDKHFRSCSNNFPVSVKVRKRRIRTQKSILISAHNPNHFDQTRYIVPLQEEVATSSTLKLSSSVKRLQQKVPTFKGNTRFSFRILFLHSVLILRELTYEASTTG